MIPIFWRYLLRSYYKVLILCMSSFITLLLVHRLKEIVKFAALSSHPIKTALFTLYQIPHILPIALPISCFISSILLFQKLTTNRELTALRKNGLSLLQILSPILLASLFLALANLFIASEVTTKCRLASKKMLYEKTTTDPFVFLEREELLHTKDLFIDKNPISSKNQIEDLLIIAKNSARNRLDLFQAKKLQTQDQTIFGENISILSHRSENEDNFDSVWMENQSSLSAPTDSLSQFFQTSEWKENTTALPMRSLLSPIDQVKSMKRNALSEIARRFSLALSVFSLTILGAGFGMDISRNRSKKKILIASFFALFVFISYIIAKQLKSSPAISLLIYFVPHLIILLAGSRSLQKIAFGVEK